MISDDLAAFRDMVADALCFRQPGLDVVVEGDMVIALGGFIVAAEERRNRDFGPLAEFEIRIELDPRYPDIEPKIFEIGGSIPHEARFHISGDGSCCILVWETWRHTAQDLSIGAFLDGPVRNFFLSQRAVALGQGWPFGEWDHGAAGLIAAYGERLGYDFDEITLKRFLRRYLKILARQEVPAFWRCPCQSGRNIRNCCQERLSVLLCEVQEAEVRAMINRLGQQTRFHNARAR